MKRFRRFVLLAALLTAAMVVACGSSPTKPTERGPRLDASWTGRGIKPGKLAVPALAEWCDTLRLLQIQATRGDSGIAIALYPQKAIVPDTYPVLLPIRADSFPPSAAIAVRWFGETSMKGFQGDSGRVVLTRLPSGAFSGQFDAAARSVNDGSRITVRGSFHELTPRPAQAGCVPKASPVPRDTGRSRTTGVPRTTGVH